jgi:hypothetical protein
MDYSICKDLERILEARHNKYIEARSAAFYRVSTELAAKENVDMERRQERLGRAPIGMRLPRLR